MRRSSDAAAVAARTFACVAFTIVLAIFARECAAGDTRRRRPIAHVLAMSAGKARRARAHAVDWRASAAVCTLAAMRAVFAPHAGRANALAALAVAT